MWGYAFEVTLSDETGAACSLSHVVNVREPHGIPHAVGPRPDGFVFVGTCFIGHQPDSILEVGFGSWPVGS